MGDTTLHSPVYAAFIDYIDGNTAVVMQSDLFFKGGILRWGATPTAFRLQFNSFKDEKWLTRGSFVDAFHCLPNHARSAVVTTLKNMVGEGVDGVLDFEQGYNDDINAEKLQEAEDRFLELISPGFVHHPKGQKRQAFVRSAFSWLTKVSEFKADIP